MSYISEINELLQICAELIGLSCRVTMDTPEYIDFDQKMESFINRYNLEDTRQYQDISQYRLTRSSQYLSSSEAQSIIQSLMALKKLQMPNRNKFDRIFISHSSDDIKYVKPFVELLESLGLDKKTMFCSSVKGYGIPIGQNIYEYLKTEFIDKNILVVMIMSNNYYNSEPCLNEMGATWVMSKEYITILVDDFEFDQLKGCVDSQKIGFKITDTDRLDEFKDNLVNGLGLALSSDYDWEATRDNFIAKINCAPEKQPN
ncbi:MAG: toll/interleukin-1 receptor domain-containing protein [Bacteroidales bacterium]|nr:toll/interleukin-1 receptor domain-containing protein [Bacteroidales bacterium]